MEKDFDKLVEKILEGTTGIQEENIRRLEEENKIENVFNRISNEKSNISKGYLSDTFFVLDISPCGLYGKVNGSRLGFNPKVEQGEMNKGLYYLGLSFAFLLQKSQIRLKKFDIRVQPDLVSIFEKETRIAYNLTLSGIFRPHSNLYQAIRRLILCFEELRSKLIRKKNYEEKVKSILSNPGGLRKQSLQKIPFPFALNLETDTVGTMRFNSALAHTGKLKEENTRAFKYLLLNLKFLWNLERQVKAAGLTSFST
eukprot:snap_masked-scaffold_4-processed-gene-0.39-mRNA-1 protein AED:1.00 eAED:1.00 QI:0/-1/0/0/-1/1/1/0/254